LNRSGQRIIRTALERSAVRVPLEHSTVRTPRSSWSIGMFVGADPLRLQPGAANAVLTCADVSDVAAKFVADPFMVFADGVWHMFFEVMRVADARGVIGHATSADGLAWRYDRVVLDEPFHLSYPHVVQADGEHVLIPESYRAGVVALYRARDFPYRWSRTATLVEGELVDPSVFRFGGRWWMFAASPALRAVDLHLFEAPELAGPWREHPMSPVVRDDAERARPAGRTILRDGVPVRFAQDCSTRYGSAVHAFEIVELTRTRYRERPVSEQPLFAGSGTGWNAARMHHVDAHQLGDGSWLACADGDAT
jgi:hypothetical protein